MVPIRVEPMIDRDEFRAVMRVLFPLVVGWMWMVPMVRMVG